MTFWSRIISNAAGHALGGPLGALLRAVFGPAGAPSPSPEPHQSVAFTIACIALCAKMAKADGVVSRSEVDVFKRLFRVPEAELAHVGRIFDMARKDTAGYEAYARQVARLFRDYPAVREELLDGLFSIAAADGVLHARELAYLQRVTALFELPETVFARMRVLHRVDAADDASDYALLGVAPDASSQDIKTAHRKLLWEHHPDRLLAQGLPSEFIALANARMAAINAAYDRLRSATVAASSG